MVKEARREVGRDGRDEDEKAEGGTRNAEFFFCAYGHRTEPANWLNGFNEQMRND